MGLLGSEGLQTLWTKIKNLVHPYIKEVSQDGNELTFTKGNGQTTNITIKGGDAYGLSSYSVLTSPSTTYMSAIKDAIQAGGGDITKLNYVATTTLLLIKFIYTGNKYYVYCVDLLNLKSYKYSIDINTTTIQAFLDMDSVAIGGGSADTSNCVKAINSSTDPSTTVAPIVDGMTTQGIGYGQLFLLNLNGYKTGSYLCTIKSYGGDTVNVHLLDLNTLKQYEQTGNSHALTITDVLSSEVTDSSDSSSPMTPITYSELKALRDNGQLVAGMFYRITDYVCTTSQENTRATDHRFDIIVQALSNSTLSEMAKADFNYYGEPYFMENDANLSAWELKYCLDNDTTRFAWALDGQCIVNLNTADSNGSPLTRQPSFDGAISNSEPEYPYAWGTQADVDCGDSYCFVYSKNETLTNGEIVYNCNEDVYQTAEVVEGKGKGVIYYMKDEFENECPYDFKNIQFKRFISYNDNGELYLDEENGELTWCYTFGDSQYDRSIPHQDLKTFRNNTIGSVYTGCTNMYYLPNNVFFDNSECMTKSNKLGNGCEQNTFLGKSQYSILGDDCCNNTFNFYQLYNTLGKWCHGNIFNGADFNTLDDECSGNVFGSGSMYNVLGQQCCENVFGEGCSRNTLYAESHYNTFIDSSSHNNLAMQCIECTIEGSYNFVLGRLSSVSISNDDRVYPL